TERRLERVLQESPVLISTRGTGGSGGRRTVCTSATSRRAGHDCDYREENVYDRRGGAAAMVSIPGQGRQSLRADFHAEVRHEVHNAAGQTVQPRAAPDLSKRERHHRSHETVQVFQFRYWRIAAPRQTLGPGATVSVANP